MVERPGYNPEMEKGAYAPEFQEDPNPSTPDELDEAKKIAGVKRLNQSANSIDDYADSIGDNKLKQNNEQTIEKRYCLRTAYIHMKGGKEQMEYLNSGRAALAGAESEYLKAAKQSFKLASEFFERAGDDEAAKGAREELKKVAEKYEEIYPSEKVAT